MPLAREYYEENIRITQELHATLISRSRFSTKPYSSLPDRQKEIRRSDRSAYRV